MKKNYQAWEIDFAEFDRQQNSTDKLRFLLRFAVLAPSSHNSQPWQFDITENKISVIPDFTRALSRSDNTNRQLYISLGCALENLLIAADYYGFETFAEPTIIENTTGIDIALQKKELAPRDPDHLIFSIPKRHTNRNKYTHTPVDKLFLEKAKALESNDIRIDFIENQEQKEKIADIVNEAMLQAMSNIHFRKELSGYLKSNITNSPIGMPGFSLGMPTPVSLIAPTLIKFVNINKLAKKQNDQLLKKFTPAFVIISTAQDTPEQWIKAGQLYERIALLAQKNGLKTNVMAAGIEIGDSYKDIQNTLHIHFRPQVFFRIGSSDKETAHSPRLHITN